METARQEAEVLVKAVRIDRNQETLSSFLFLALIPPSFSSLGSSKRMKLAIIPTISIKIAKAVLDPWNFIVWNNFAFSWGHFFWLDCRKLFWEQWRGKARRGICPSWSWSWIIPTILFRPALMVVSFSKPSTRSTIVSSPLPSSHSVLSRLVSRLRPSLMFLISYRTRSCPVRWLSSSRFHCESWEGQDCAEENRYFVELSLPEVLRRCLEMKL